MKFLLTLIISLALNISFSQEKKTSNIEDVFQKEFSAYPDSDIAIYLITPPDVLPDWFFTPPQGDKDNFYSIGISDPWIDVEKGNKQAKSRAYCLANFMNNVAAKGVSDLYNKDGPNYKFEQISRFYPLSKTLLEGFLVDSFVTKYKERIFLYKFNIGKAVTQNYSLIDCYKSVVRQDAGYSKLEKIELYGKIDEAEIQYEYTEKDNDFEILSVFNSDTIVIKPTVYQYTNKKNKSETDTNAEISLFRRGLWHGFFKSLIDNLDLAASEIGSHQKSVSDTHQNAKKARSFSQLNRGIYNASFKFDIAAIELTNKEMVIHFKTIKIP